MTATIFHNKSNESLVAPEWEAEGAEDITVN